MLKAASAVMADDMLPGLDNGYVVEVEASDVSLQVGPGFGMTGLLTDMVVITYHDREGEECYLILPPDSLLEVL